MKTARRTKHPKTPPTAAVPAPLTPSELLTLAESLAKDAAELERHLAGTGKRAVARRVARTRREAERLIAGQGEREATAHRHFVAALADLHAAFVMNLAKLGAAE